MKDSVVMTTRTQQLALPKPSLLTHPHRRSVYWLDRLPARNTDGTTRTELTPRWTELCRTRRSCEQANSLLRPSPVWPVSTGALQAVPSERLRQLAQPKTPAPGWQPELPLLTPLSRATQTAMASPRTCHLARPKRRQALPDFTPGPEAKTPATYRASAHTELLASPKHEHPRYRRERSPLWPVSRAARSYTASPRVLELSSPRERKDPGEGHHMTAVSRAACSAGPSARLRQLSLPQPRKCSSQ